jgi:hypothetical protein
MVIPGPKSIIGSQCFGGAGEVSREDLAAAAATFNSIIEKQAAEGWRFVCFDNTSIHSACCVVLSKKETMIKLLVFERE